MDSNETIKQAVMAGLGIALLSEHTLIEELRSNRLVRLYAEGVPIYRQWYLLRPAAFRPTPSEEKIRQLISDMKGDFLPTL